MKLILTALAYVQYKRSPVYEEDEHRVILLTEHDSETVNPATAMYKLLEGCPWRSHMTEFCWGSIWKSEDGHLYADLCKDIDYFDPVTLDVVRVHAITPEMKVDELPNLWLVYSNPEDCIYEFAMEDSK